ncbi:MULTISPECIES: SprT-like domain-containing protein [Pseudomonas]|jgi:SprT protein|uniref:SprT family zinc-dependent metalloprotease n=1 Tax=Pseudomonas TaxID=286 RepID=UPI0018E8FDB1|nr:MULTISPECIES: SprT-like domain-containing protein [Pseudomonas]MBJ2286700.1 SprT-like domain-containing protein [Pseudomonas sp. MF6755]MDH0796113.1 SprT-like domain-containing protein [Pseudomonas carnis]
MLPVDEFKAIKKRVTECLHLASAHFGETFPEIPIKFDLTGVVGGYFCYRRCRSTGKETRYFRFNRVLARENLKEYLDQICPHEVAHYIARSKWGKGIKPHGVEWKSVMIEAFNLAPDRCHSMDTSSVENIPFVYRCGCKEHRMSKRRHNRILRGAIYKCNSCRKAVTFLREEALIDKNINVIPKLFVSTADSPLSDAHIRQIAGMIIEHQVMALVADPLMKVDAKLGTLGKTLRVSESAVTRHTNPSTLPGGVTHAIIFGDCQVERQQRVAKAFEQRGVIVRKVRIAKA